MKPEPIGAGQYRDLQELLAVLRQASVTEAKVTLVDGKVTGLDVGFYYEKTAEDVASPPAPEKSGDVNLDEDMPDLAIDPTEAVRASNFPAK